MPGTSLTWRKLLVLVRQLPPESAVNTAIRNRMPESVMERAGAAQDPVRSKWSSLDHLIALLIDELRMQTWVYMQSNSDKRVPRPSPIRRPGLPARAQRSIPLTLAQKLDPRLRGLSGEAAQAMMDQLTRGAKRLEVTDNGR